MFGKFSEISCRIAGRVYDSLKDHYKVFYDVDSIYTSSELEKFVLSCCKYFNFIYLYLIFYIDYFFIIFYFILLLFFYYIF